MNSNTALSQLLVDIKIKTLQQALSSFILSPLFRIRIVVQTSEEDVKQKQMHHDSGMAITNHVRKNQGTFSLWKGWLLPVGREITGALVHYLLKNPVHSLVATLCNSGIAFLSSSLSSNGSETQQQTNHIVESLLLGIVVSEITSPFDVIYTHLAIDTKPSAIMRYDGVLDCARKMWNSEGIYGFFKGSGAAALQVVLYRSTFLLLASKCKTLFLQNDADQQPFWKLWLLYQTVSVTSSLISYPMDTVRRRMAIQPNSVFSRKYKNSFDCFNQIVLQEGVLSLYKGFFLSRITNLAGAIISLAVLIALEE